MTTPTSFKPLRDAVMYALTNATGKPRALSESHLFARATAADARQRAAGVVTKPRALVVVKNAIPDIQGGVLQGDNVQRDLVTVEITLWYYGGSELFSAETDAALDRIDADTPLIVAALCQPGALLTDQNGNGTGLDGGSLRIELWSSQGPDPIPVQETAGAAQRIFRVVHRFGSVVELAQPS